MATPPRESVLERRAVLALLWIVIAAVGVPYWWSTTTIERRPLSTTRIQAWKAREPCFIHHNINLDVAAVQPGPEPLSETSTDAAFAQLRRLAATKCINLHKAPGQYQVQVSRGNGAAESIRLEDTTAHASTTSNSDQDIAQVIIDAATALLELDAPAADARVANYAPKYKLVFSLMNEDSASGAGIHEWDIDTLIADHIEPLLEALAPLHEFQLDTSIQHFSPLAVPVGHDERGSLVKEDDLRAFVNNADWNLPVSITLDPVLHFMLFVPSMSNRPMRIDSSIPSNAFITPQRGGVVIFNPPAAKRSDSPTGPLELSASDLAPAFNMFRQQLSKILGVPRGPISSSARSSLAQWQIDSMVRARVLEATKNSVDTLQAIHQVVRDVPNMRVGKLVQARVSSALNHLDEASQRCSTNASLALSHASTASILASDAYFDPSMLALLYFPDEHKYAVYTPLFGPVAVPLLVGLLKEVKSWRERRRTTVKDGQGQPDEVDDDDDDDEQSRKDR